MTLIAVLTPLTDAQPGETKLTLATCAVSGQEELQPGWLTCNGALVSRTANSNKLEALFQKIGFAYSPTPGEDPGSGNFYLPSPLDGYNLIPKGVTNFTVRGTKGGEYQHALTEAEIPSHYHAYWDTLRKGTADGSLQPADGIDWAGFAIITPARTSGGPSDGTYSTGAGNAATAHENMPPVLVIGGVLIKY